SRVAILEDDTLVELLYDRPDQRRTVGDIYLGRVDAVLPGLQAAFVDIGLEKSAFLHASDLVEPEEDEEPGEEEEGEDGADEAEDAEPARAGNGNGNGGGRRRRGRRPVPDIGDVLKKGETILVQVTKEPISTKGCRVTSQVSLPGRFLVYMPHASRVGVSRKIEQREQRAKLREMVSKVVPKDVGGFIVRTVAEDVTEAHFQREVEALLGLWRKINRKKLYVRAPALVHRETSLTRGIIRDLFSDKVDALHVDTKE